MTTVTRRRALRFFGVSVALAAAMTTLPSAAQDRTSVKIGYAISKTGPNSGGARRGRRDIFVFPHASGIEGYESFNEGGIDIFGVFLDFC